MNSAWKAACAALTVVGLAACAVGPNFTLPAPPAQKAYTSRPVVLPAAGESDPQQMISVGASVPAQWWRRFGSPMLDSTVALALADSPTLEQARATLAQARQAVRVAEGGLYPQVELGAALSRSRSRQASTYGAEQGNLYSAGPLVGYSPDAFGGTRRLIEQQGALADLQREQLAAAQLSLAGNVVSQAIGIASVGAQTAAVEAILEIDRHNVDLVRLSVQAGTAAPADLLTAQSQLAGDEALLPPLRQQLAAAADVLAMLVGRSAGNWQAPAFDFTSLVLPADLPVVVPSALVRARPDIRGAEALLHATSAAIGVATARLYPQISLSSSWTQQSATMGALFDGSNGLWAVAASLTAPIFNGGALKAQQQSAIDAFEAQLATYRQTVLLAFNQVADVLQALEHDAQLIAAQRKALDTSTTSLRLAQDSYAAGAVSFLQVLATQRIYEQARLGYAKAVGQRYLDTAQLFAAMGGGAAQFP
ncbi:putative efflux pump outer membrane protein TtgC precursor [mine drainage metagenome]|uniref:Putative efflux pump outer membrane protein TtgC n=1 Tax=mine drainage metagenome TaxID=410659 RepID=A0A1J5R760_9ZZZZ